DLPVLLIAELQAVFERPVRGPEGTFARSRELFLRVDHFDGPLLEFHRVRSAVLRRIDQTLGELEVAVVVDPDLGDHEAGLTFSHQTVTDSNRSPHPRHSFSDAPEPRVSYRGTNPPG